MENVPISFSQNYTSSINTLKDFKNNFNFMEPHVGNSMSGEDNIGETLTDSADGNTEGMEQSSP